MHWSGLVIIGLAVWIVVAVPVALLTGPWLRKVAARHRHSGPPP